MSILWQNLRGDRTHASHKIHKQIARSDHLDDSDMKHVNHGFQLYLYIHITFMFKCVRVRETNREQK